MMIHKLKWLTSRLQRRASTRFAAGVEPGRARAERKQDFRALAIQGEDAEDLKAADPSRRVRQPRLQAS